MTCTVCHDAHSAGMKTVEGETEILEMLQPYAQTATRTP